MAISGSFAAASLAQQRELQPTTPPAPPSTKHNTRDEPKTAWVTPPSPNGSGMPEELETEVNLTPHSSGIKREIGSLFRSHNGSRKNVRARAGVFVNDLVSQYGDAPGIVADAAQWASVEAHSDQSQKFIWPQAYSEETERPSTTYYTVDDSQQEGPPISSGKVLARTRNSFSTPIGGDSEFQVQGAKNGFGGRFFVSNYSSLTTKGAMYSKNTLRGVVPQEAVVPVVTPALTTGVGSSGIQGNDPAKAKLFSTPRLARTPQSVSDTITAAQVDSTGYDYVGTW